MRYESTTDSEKIVATVNRKRDREAFRRLTSNASDALDTIYYESIIIPVKIKAQTFLFIMTSPDKTNSTLAGEDSGIGMAKNDIVNNRGLTAKSGTKASTKAMAVGGDIYMIGQCGVGFYTAYLVSDKVRVATKKELINNLGTIVESGTKSFHGSNGCKWGHLHDWPVWCRLLFGSIIIIFCSSREIYSSSFSVRC